MTVNPHPTTPADPPPSRAAALVELFGLLLILVGAGAIGYGAFLIHPALSIISAGGIAVWSGSLLTTRRVDE